MVTGCTFFEVMQPEIRNSLSELLSRVLWLMALKGPLTRQKWLNDSRDVAPALPS